jgi:hypothetical protein
LTVLGFKHKILCMLGMCFATYAMLLAYIQ